MYSSLLSAQLVSQPKAISIASWNTAILGCTRRRYFLFVVACCSLLAGHNPAYAAAPIPESDFNAIQVAFDRGEYRAVIGSLERQMSGNVPTIHSAEQIHWLLIHADSYRGLGMHTQATNLLFAVRGDVESQDNQSGLHALYFGRVAIAYQFAGNDVQALAYLDKGLAIAEKNALLGVQSSLQNDLGNLYVSRKNYAAGIDEYRTSLAQSIEIDDPALIAAAAINLGRALLASNNTSDVARVLVRAENAVSRMPASADRLGKLLSLGRLYQSAQNTLGGNSGLRASANDQLLQALDLATDLSDERSASYALGYLGGLYEDEKRFEEALQLASRAVLLAQKSDANEAIYQWQWQMARLLVKLDDVDAGIEAYRSAVKSIKSIRTSLVTGANDVYRESVGPLYFEMADLLLQRTPTLRDAELVQANLVEVRETLESLKTAEIVEYFDNDCVILDQDKAALELLSTNAAIVYPILLEDRLELLISFPGEIHQLSVPVSKYELTQEVRRYRLAIESMGSGERFMPSAQKLYSWLIRPMEPLLAGRRIETLVFVPDGALRTIPMSALHDGRQFLVEKYALATTPGISLTSTQAIQRLDVEVLANGITEAVQGFAALPNVAEELRGIGVLYPTRLNQDNNFQLSSVERSMSEGQYSIVHIATHGQFDSDHRNSFLLTYDDKMTMNRLENVLNLRRYQEEQIELLVLSACQTAAGDDRAALGMAGVALKAGAKSALATLWFINDASTSDLMQDFYRNLKTNGMTKAEALRQAQIKMLANPEQSHPAHWAPFLLIGNWL